MLILRHAAAAITAATAIPCLSPMVRSTVPEWAPCRGRGTELAHYRAVVSKSHVLSRNGGTPALVLTSQIANLTLRPNRHLMKRVSARKTWTT